MPGSQTWLGIWLDYLLMQAAHVSRHLNQAKHLYYACHLFQIQNDPLTQLCLNTQVPVGTGFLTLRSYILDEI